MRRQILVIDDNALERRTVCEALSEQPFIIETASAMQAIGMLMRCRNTLSAIVLSQGACSADDYSLLQRLRAYTFSSQIPIIVIAAHADADSELTALCLGANDYIVMPCDKRIITARLQGLINLREMAAISNGLNIDNTAQQKTAEQKTREANRVKSEFLSRMSHDIRTPMNAIVGMIALAKEENNPPLTVEYLNSIGVTSQFLLNLINDILDLSAIEAGKLKLYEEIAQLDDIINSVIMVTKPMMEAKDIDFIINKAYDEASIVIDTTRLQQILFNVLANAAKYTPNGGRVVFSITKTSEKGGRTVLRCAIQDNGIGMSEEFLKTAFDLFTQHDNIVNSQLQGSGLGLAIVKSIVEAMGGKVDVISKLGEGTEFIIDLYINEVGAMKHINADIADYSDLSGMNILLVEDNDTNILILKRLLESKGCVVAVAKNGLEAVSMFWDSALEYYDVILMDVRMPVLDGIAATERIRALDRDDAARVPIIAMTADAFVEDRNKTIEAGMNVHLTKPVIPQVLYRTLSNYR